MQHAFHCYLCEFDIFFNITRAVAEVMKGQHY
jgi:hypothetical protein